MKKEGIKFFKENPRILYDEEIQMKVYRPSVVEKGVWLDDTNGFYNYLMVLEQPASIL